MSMVFGSEEYYRHLIQNHLLVRNWLPNGEDGALIGALACAIASSMEFTFDQIVYTQRQTRLATATDVFLDLIAQDFIGKNKLLRRANEGDEAYRARIKRALLRKRGTRQALSDAIEELTGFKPVLWEPRKVSDTARWGKKNEEVAVGFGWGEENARLGSKTSPATVWIDVTRPAGVGNPGKVGWTNHIPDGPPPETPDPIDITPAPLFINAGQSNALGYLIPRSDVPTHLQAPMANALIWDTPNGVWAQLHAGYNTGTPANPENFGAEAEFAKQWCDAHPGKTCYFVKSVKGSTQLAVDNAIVDWSPNSVGELFDIAQTAVTAAKANLTANGIDFRVRDILWMQGENDATVSNATADAYEANLTGLVSAMRSRWGDANTTVTIGRIHLGTGFAYGTQVRQAQANVANNVANVKMVDTDSYPMNPGDNLHFTAAGQVMMGSDMFAVYPEPTPIYEEIEVPEVDDGFEPMPGGYGAGGLAFGSKRALLGSISDAEIYQTINDTKAAGITVMVKINRANTAVFPINKPPVWETESGHLGSFNETSTVTIPLVATDPGGEPVTYTLTGGSLPSALSLNANTGIISGTLGNALVDATSTFSVTAAEAGGKTATRSFTITKLHLNTPPVFTTNTAIGNFLTGNAMSVTFTSADQESDPVTYSVAPGSVLPNGMSLAANGTLSGMFTDIGNALSFSLRVTDDKFAYTEKTFTANVGIGAAIYIGNATLTSSGGGTLIKPPGTQAGDYMLIFNPGQTINVSGGDGGWTLNQYTSAGGWTMGCLHKRLTANDVANTINISGGSWGPFLGVVYRGAIAAKPIAYSLGNYSNTVSMALPAAGPSACGWVTSIYDRGVSTGNNVVSPTGWNKRNNNIGNDGNFVGYVGDKLSIPMPTANSVEVFSGFETSQEQWAMTMELVSVNSAEFYQPYAIDRTYEANAIIDLPANGATVFDMGYGGADSNIAARFSVPVSNASVYGFEINCGDMQNAGQGQIGVCSAAWFTAWTTNYPSSKPPNSNGAGNGMFWNTTPGVAYSSVNVPSYYGAESGSTSLGTQQINPTSSQIIGVVVNLTTRKMNLFLNGVLKNSVVLSASATGPYYPYIATWAGQTQGQFRATKSTFWSGYYV